MKESILRHPGPPEALLDPEAGPPRKALKEPSLATARVLAEPHKGIRNLDPTQATLKGGGLQVVERDAPKWGEENAPLSPRADDDHMVAMTRC